MRAVTDLIEMIRPTSVDCLILRKKVSTPAQSLEQLGVAKGTRLDAAASWLDVSCEMFRSNCIEE